MNELASFDDTTDFNQSIVFRSDERPAFGLLSPPDSYLHVISVGHDGATQTRLADVMLTRRQVQRLSDSLQAWLTSTTSKGTK